MWAQTHRFVPDRYGAQLLASSAATYAPGPRLRDPPVEPRPPPPPAAARPTSLSLVTAGGTFLLVDDPIPPLPTKVPAATAAATSNFRDSFLSILDDPFFLTFHIPDQPGSLQTALRRDDERQPWPPPRKESLSEKNPTPWHSLRDMDAINIAVIGADGVGKSSLIQRALRSQRPPSLVTTVRQEVDGSSYQVTLVELDLEVFDVDPEQPIQWPKQVGGHMLPRIDGALVLYDVINKDSIRYLPQAMSVLANDSLPTILVATKCETPENLRQLDTAGVAHAFPSCAGHFRTSSNVPGSARECLQAMLRAVAARRVASEKADGPGTRRRAASTANLDAPPELINGRPISQHSKHSRASSDFSLLRGFPAPPNEGYYRGQVSRSPRLEYQNYAPYSTPNLNSDAPNEGAPQTVSSLLRTPGIRLDSGGESFLDIEESDSESYRYSDDIPILQRNDESFIDRPVKSAGVSFDDLVDRLLSQRMTRSDSNFAEIFLCLYRKFAAPCELLAAILVRLERVRNDGNMHTLIRIDAQMRMVEVVAKWVSLYPGDFARPATRKNLEELIRNLSGEPIFYAAAQQMRDHLEQKVVEDDDTGWAKSDDVDENWSGPADRLSGLGKDAAAGRKQSEFAESMGSSQPDELGPVSQRRPSQGSELSDLHSGRTPVRFQFHSFEDYDREAATMVPTATLPLNKFRYHIFMDIDAEDIADEITRIDWVMFGSIRIRDMVRHVSLPLDQKEKCRSLKNINRMVAHFNHVAKWVSNMILIRDKAKHRAPCLEKFMVIASKLRLLNNYNGLAAVLAGINGTAVHRLTQTRALVAADVQKRFARLVLLMGTQKSHFAYRLAWENSPLPRIPFMPLHRRDLVSAEEGSMTFVGPNGDRINWKKFEVLGEVLLPIMKSQGQSYPNLNKHEASRELILDCRMSTDDEDIYQRSLQVESGSGSAAESKKKFPWLPNTR
ncbi:ras guanine nucleotide exchange factor domain-containing protein [Lasiosphaeria miniovina]|uniref:Ras guanine nucleotide exchange factor domain-containing protein n=1 Tax=Lasiosphaeria miniovina TaxID=1954250 RepID=A0AA39ZZH5_9PEZI|nr:ras guanine nucleotide exchange factor domain-containing protein [Lasiosphaeria miniovina]KAK0706454.1 ras guanine nucleotide exchange factor domain-containing protein [Lasiosphaeria miniovina]